MSTADATAALLTASGPRRIALVKKLSKEKQLGNLDMGEIINGGTRSLLQDSIKEENSATLRRTA